MIIGLHRETEHRKIYFLVLTPSLCLDFDSPAYNAREWFSWLPDQYTHEVLV